MTKTLCNPRSKSTNITNLFLVGEDGWLYDEGGSRVDSLDMDFHKTIIKNRFTIDELKSVINKRFVEYSYGKWLDQGSIEEIERISKALESDIFEEIIEPLSRVCLDLIILAKYQLNPVHSYNHSKKYFSLTEAEEYYDSDVIGYALVDTEKHYGSYCRAMSDEDGRDMWNRMESELYELNVFMNDGCTDFDDVKALEVVY